MLSVVNAMDTMITAPLGFLCIQILTEDSRFNRGITRGLSLIYYLISIGWSSVFFWTQGVNQQHKSFVSGVGIIICLIFLLIIYKFQNGRLIFAFFTISILIFIGDTISDILGCKNLCLHFVVKVAVFLTIIFLLLRFIRKPYRWLMNKITTGWMYLIWLPVSLGLTFVSMIILPGPLIDNREYWLPAGALCVVSFCCYYTIFYVFENIEMRHRVEQNNQLMDMQLKSLKRQLDDARKLENDVSQFRHDMRHYILILQRFLSNENLENAQKALDSLSDHSENLHMGHEIVEYSGDLFVDILLSDYKIKAETAGVSFEVWFDKPQNHQESMEFCVVLSNILENALNASMKVPDESQRWIQIKGVQRGKQFFLEAANRYEGKIYFDEKRRPVTESENHGYGIQSICEFAEKCNGNVSYKALDKTFILQMIID